VQLGGKLNAANQLDPGLPGRVAGQIDAGKRVVIGNAQNLHASAKSFVYELLGRRGAVGFIGVGM
jgi:hypothetical protein